MCGGQASPTGESMSISCKGKLSLCSPGDSVVNWVVFPRDARSDLKRKGRENRRHYHVFSCKTGTQSSAEFTKPYPNSAFCSLGERLGTQTRHQGLVLLCWAVKDSGCNRGGVMKASQM